MVFSQQAILDQLARLKENKSRKDYFRPKDYQEFLPETLGYEPRDTTLRYQHLDQENARNRNATLLEQIKAENRQNHQEMLRRRQELQRARGGLRNSRNNQPAFAPVGLNYGNYEGERNFGPRWGPDNTPEVSDLKRINPNAPIQTVTWRGRSFQVNRQVAPIFIAFLDDLYASGYRPVSIGGHNDRNIAGTNTPSLHSYGLAIDIDPGRNPVGPAGSNNHALPPNVASLAAKYGLSWGGTWNSYRDPMHFSVAYGGQE